MGNLNAHPLKN